MNRLSLSAVVFACLMFAGSAVVDAPHVYAQATASVTPETDSPQMLRVYELANRTPEEILYLAQIHQLASLKDAEASYSYGKRGRLRALDVRFASIGGNLIVRGEAKALGVFDGIVGAFDKSDKALAETASIGRYKLIAITMPAKAKPKQLSEILRHLNYANIVTPIKSTKTLIVLEASGEEELEVRSIIHQFIHSI